MNFRGATKHNILLYFLAFSIPLFLVQFINFYVLKRNIFNIECDFALSFFSIGINFISGLDLAGFHHPATLFRQLSGFIVKNVLDLDLDHPDLVVEKFAVIGIYIHIFFVVLISFWTAKVMRHFVDIKTTLLVSLCVASMPAMFLFSTEFGPYYILSLILVPISVSIFDYIQSDKFRPYELFFSYFLLGIVVSNYYLLLVTSFCLILVPFAKMFIQVKKGTFNAVETPRFPVWTLLSVFWIVFWLSEFDFKYLILPFLFVVLLLYPKIKKSIESNQTSFVRSFLNLINFVVAPTMLGMLVGANIHAHRYLATLLEVRQTYSTESFNLVAFFKKFFFVGYWHVFVICALIFFAYSIILGFRRRIFENSHIISGISLCIIALSGFGIANSYSSMVVDSRFGIESRFLLWFVPVAIFLILTASLLKKRAVLLLCLAVSILSMGQFLYLHWGRAADVDLFSKRVDAEIEKFMKVDSDRVVVCFNDFFPSRYCSSAFAFNKYRGAESRQLYSARWLYNHKIFWYDTGYFDIKMLKELKGNYRKILIVGWDFRFSSLEKFYEDANYSSESIFNNDYVPELNTLGLKVKMIELVKKN